MKHNYARTLLTVIALFVAINGLTQRDTRHGYSLPVNPDPGDTVKIVKVLVAWAEVTQSYDQQSPVTGYGTTSLPANVSDYFDLDYTPGTTPSAFVTKYLYEASFGSYIVVADYLDHMVQVTNGDNGYDPIVDYMDSLYNRSLLQQKLENNSNLADFDNFSIVTLPQYRAVEKPSQSNNKADVLLIIWENHPSFSGGGHGLGPKVPFVSAGMGPFTGIENAAAFGDLGPDFVVREFFHAMYGHDDWHTAGGAGAYTFITTANNHSITGQHERSSSTICGWDRYHISWYHPDNTLDTLIALDGSGNPTVSDLTIQANADSQVFILRDHYQTGDAIRIKLPHIDWQTSGDKKNQYLWLENRQAISDFDVNRGCDRWVPGLYAYLQVGKDVRSGTRDDIYPVFGGGPFVDYVHHRNGAGNFLFPLTAEGNWDFKYRTDFAQNCNYADCCWGLNNTLPIDRYHEDTRDNPLTGFSSLVNKTFDPNYPGYYVGLSEIINDSLVHNAHQYGSDKTAFRLGSTSKLALYTNPAPLPVYTYKSHDYDDNFYPHNIPSWENRTIWLNGLSIEILDTISNTTTGGHDIKIKIKWDDYDVLEDVRWTGNIVLQNDDLDPQSRQSKIILAAGKKIDLERGLSPTQHAVNDTFNGQPLFTRPTVFTAREGTLLHLKENSTLNIRDDSKLIVEDDVQVKLEENACIVVHPGATLEINSEPIELLGPNARIVVKQGGTLTGPNGTTYTFVGDGYVKLEGSTLVLDSDHRLVMEDSTRLEVEEDALLDIREGVMVLQDTWSSVIVRGGGTIKTGDEVDLTFDGNGYLQFYEGAITDLGEDSRLILQGDGKTDLVMELHDADVNVSGHNIDIRSGKVLYHGGSLRTASAEFWSTSTAYEGATTALVLDTLSSFFMSNCDFTGMTKGIKMTYADSAKDEFGIHSSNFTELLYGLDLTDIQRKVRLSFCTIGAPDDLLGYGISATRLPLVQLEHTDISHADVGIVGEEITGLYLNYSTVDSSYTGLDLEACNVFLRQESYVRDNGVGISMTGSVPDSLYLLTVGDYGCAHIIGNSEVGVQGTNVKLHIDAQQHAINRGLPNDIRPNRFDGNTEVFVICNGSELHEDTIQATYNYWDNGQALSSNDYTISRGYPNPCKALVGNTINSVPYETSVPTACSITGISDSGIIDNDTTFAESVYHGSTECYSSLATDGQRELAEIYSKGYKDFVYQKWTAAKPRLDTIASETTDTTVYSEDGCRHCVWVARALAGVTDAHIGYEPEEEQTGKRGSGKEADPHAVTSTEDSWTIYPNPARKVFTISGPSDFEGTVQLVQLMGSTVFAKRFAGLPIDIPLKDLPGGVYVIKITSKDGTGHVTRQVVVQ